MARAVLDVDGDPSPAARELFPDFASDGYLFIERVEILEEHLGKGYGLDALAALIRNMDAKAQLGLTVCLLAGRDAAPEDARLVWHWSKLGFQRLQGRRARVMALSTCSLETDTLIRSRSKGVRVRESGYHRG